MRRRGFITLLGGAAVLAPLTTRAQHGAPRRVGFLSGLAEDDPEARDRIGAFRDEFKKLGCEVVGASVDMLARYYAQYVIQGPGAFVERADDYDDFEQAMRRKLLRELGVFQMSAGRGSSSE